MKQWLKNISVGLAAFTTLGVVQAGQPDQDGTAAFTIFLRGQRIGSEEVTVTRSPSGWQISSKGRTGAPLDFSFEKFLARYAADWQSQSLEVSGQMRARAFAQNGLQSGHGYVDVVQYARVRLAKVSADTIAAQQLLRRMKCWRSGTRFSPAHFRFTRAAGRGARWSRKITPRRMQMSAAVRASTARRPSRIPMARCRGGVGTLEPARQGRDSSGH
jgi:hypothetical protein